MRVYLFLSCFVVLSACVGPVTKDNLRQKPAYNVNFEVNRPYQQVFSDLLAQTRACYLHKEQERQITVVGNRDNGRKTAMITIEEVYAMAEHDAYIVIDLVSKSENLTQISAYVSRKEAQNEVKSIQQWALQENHTCEVKWLS